MAYHDGKLPGTVERVYYAVPSHYGIGDEFTEPGDAIKAAKAKVTCFIYEGQAKLPRHPTSDPRRTFTDGDALIVYSRAFWDERRVTKWADRSSTDEVHKRTEVFLNEDERAAVLQAVRAERDRKAEERRAWVAAGRP